jgi:hypothetical protein
LANTDIFNPVIRWSEALGFNPNWSYRSPRRTAANYAFSKAAFGRRQTRAIGNDGYSFDLTFVDRPIAQVLYIRRFYEQFQNGFFTLIDYDNDDRNHVGNFTAYQDDTETANNKYTIRVTFTEMPGALALTGPSDWANSSRYIHVVDDWMKWMVATQGAAWLLQQTPAAVAVGAPQSDPSTYEMFEAAPAAGDFAQVEYIGWGFSLPLRQAATLGIVNVFLDGKEIVAGLDLSTYAYTSVKTTPDNAVVNLLAGSGVTTIQTTGVSLGRHRLKIVATGTKNAAATAAGILFPVVQVII